VCEAPVVVLVAAGVVAANATPPPIQVPSHRSCNGVRCSPSRKVASSLSPEAPPGMGSPPSAAASPPACSCFCSGVLILDIYPHSLGAVDARNAVVVQMPC
jgi:hypothetical protein